MAEGRLVIDARTRDVDDPGIVRPCVLCGRQITISADLPREVLDDCVICCDDPKCMNQMVGM